MLTSCRQKSLIPHSINQTVVKQNKILLKPRCMLFKYNYYITEPIQQWIVFFPLLSLWTLLVKEDWNSRGQAFMQAYMYTTNQDSGLKFHASWLSCKLVEGNKSIYLFAFQELNVNKFSDTWDGYFYWFSRQCSVLLNETEIHPHSKLFYACMKDNKLLFIAEFEGPLVFTLCGQNVTSLIMLYPQHY